MTESTISRTQGAEPMRLSPTDAHELLAAGRAVLVDVRDAALYENSHPRGAVSLPFATLQDSAGRLPAGFPVPPDGVVILYCA